MTGFNGHSHLWYVCLASLHFKKDIVDDAELDDHLCLSRCSFQEATTIDAHHVRLKSHYTIRLSFFPHTINDNLMTTQPNLISLTNLCWPFIHPCGSNICTQASINFIFVSFYFKVKYVFAFSFQFFTTIS